MTHCIRLSQSDGIVNETMIYKGLKKDFIYEVDVLVANDPENWKGDIFGTVCEMVEKTENTEADYVSIPIENEDGVDGGYVHVWGWKIK